MLSAGIERRGVATPRSLLLVLAAGLLAFSGCGGGGGSSDSSSTGSASSSGSSSSGSSSSGSSSGVASTPQISLFAGNSGGAGDADGTGSAARFKAPFGVAMDRAGNVYVADAGNRAVRKISTSGVVSTLWTGAGDTGGPYSIAVDSVGNLYATYGIKSLVKISPTGERAALPPLSGTCGTASATSGEEIYGSIAIDGADNLYVSVKDSHVICRITPAGAMTTLAGIAGVFGSADGSAGSATFNSPRELATDGAGNVYVADTGNATVRKISAAGVVTTLAGTAGVFDSTDGKGAAASFSALGGVSVDGAGNVYVAEWRSNTIRKIAPDGVVTTLAGEAGLAGSADGAGAEARFRMPWGLATDVAGNLYVGDVDNNAIRKITPSGMVSTVAGMASGIGSSDGTAEAASFNAPMGLAADGTGNVYVADYLNATVRKLTPTGVVTTLAGTAGAKGNSDGAGATASFSTPHSVAVDGVGNLYVADAKASVIRKIDSTGVVTTLAGTAGLRDSTDGVGAAARFNCPTGVTTDNAGNVYVADRYNNAIRKITPAGVVTTVVATLNQPLGVAIDGEGNLYVPDSDNTLLRKISPTGTVTTLATTGGKAGFIPGQGEGFGVTIWSVSVAVGIAVDGAGNVYVSDTGNSTILKVTATGTVSTLIGTSGQFGFQPGSLPGVISSPAGLAISGNTLYFSLPNGIGRVTNLF